MFIPAEPTRGHSHAHFLSESRGKGHDGPTFDASPCGEREREREDELRDNAQVICKTEAGCVSEAFSFHRLSSSMTSAGSNAVQGSLEA